MTLNIPELRTINTRMTADFHTAYNTGTPPDEQINPSMRNSPSGAIIFMSSQELNCLYRMLDFVNKQHFLDTAEVEFLERLAKFIGVTRNPATGSQGNITITGTLGAIIPINRNFTNTSGNIYVGQSAQTITTISISTTLIRTGTKVTATTISNHSIGIGMSITISGAIQTDYNNTFIITSVPSATSFTFEIATTPVTPATGTILSSYNGAVINLKSSDLGQSTNIDVGGVLNLSNIIVGVNPISYILFQGLSGGADTETVEAFRSRAILKNQNPNTPFSANNITNISKEVPGVTRVWVIEPTSINTAGQVTILFVRDNDVNIFPSASEILDVRNKILTIKPAPTYEGDVFVKDPTGVAINITITGLSPNTIEMKTAINNSFLDFFKNQVKLGQDILLTQLNNAVFNTIDATGARPTAFTITLPTADITINTEELAIAGTIIIS